jgi:transketolase
MDEEEKKLLEKVATTIRVLSMDAIQKANSGHPGLPLGCAEIGAYLYGKALCYNPKKPRWINRDRFILSAGHGSMLLYSCLHMAGFDLALEDIQQFRQLNSKTPGHPEKNLSLGVETTTGPLGQGLAHGIGHALGLKLLGARFNTEEYPLINNKVFVLASDGDIMEGVSAEASSLAGHLNLNNVVVIYDYNMVTLDGSFLEASSEDVKARYKAYGWDVFEIDGHNLEEIHTTITALKGKQERPALVLAHTTIGQGAPNKAGTYKAHGSPLGEAEIALAKENLGVTEEEFYVPKAVRVFFEQKNERDTRKEQQWREMFKEWADAFPERYKEFEIMSRRAIPDDIEKIVKEIDIANPTSGREASGAVVNVLAQHLPYIYGGSADLSTSDKTTLNDMGLVGPQQFSGRNIKYGVREFAMGAMNVGLSQTGMIRPFCGTFLVFSDYMRNAIRLAALMKEPVIYQFTHDSIFVGEDGPTHQPVEHIAALRAIPSLHVIRPADSNEVKMAWLAALNYKGPTALILSRQKLPLLPTTDVPYESGVARGAYIVKKEKEKPDFTFFASGSELSLALDVADELEKLGKDIRVVSMPCMELFEAQSERYKSSVVDGDIGKRVSIEAGIEQGWYKYIGREGVAICVEGFGASAPAGALRRELGYNIDAILDRVL